MADSVRGERRNSGGSGKPKRRKVEPDGTSWLIMYVFVETCISMAVRGSGYLALGWSTVALLGGFVSSLERKDFWCITFLSMIQAAGIFNDWVNITHQIFDINATMTSAYSVLGKITNNWLDQLLNKIHKVRFLGFVLFQILVLPLCCVATGVNITVILIYNFGPLFCAAISAWRIGDLNFRKKDPTASMENFIAALDIFYSLVIFQGTIFGVLIFTVFFGRQSVVSHLQKREELPFEWGWAATFKFLIDTRVKFRSDPASIKDKTLINYAVGLLDSEFPEEYLCGARLLSAFVKKGKDIRSLLLPSRHKIQKLIDALRIRSNPKETRELAATIMADLAGDIDLAQYPGALRCISSLLQEETTQMYYNKQVPHPLALERPLLNEEQLMQSFVKAHSSSDNDREGSSSNKLILQGLTILERLASEQHNRRDIRSAPDLLHKITAPLYSTTLIQDVNKNSAWAEVVNGTLKVLYSLIQDPGDTSRSLRREITSNKQAMINLKKILRQDNQVCPELQIQSSMSNQDNIVNEDSNAGLEMQMPVVSNQEKIKDNKAWPQLQMRAMEILTQLALDPTIPSEESSEQNGDGLCKETKEYLISKQLEVFLAIEETTFKATAGRNLALLSTNSQTRILAGVNLLPDKEKIAACLNAKDDIIQRKIAAEILENLLCAHYDDLDKQFVKDTLLQVFSEIPSLIKATPPESKNRDEVKGNRPQPQWWPISKKKNNEKQQNSAPRNDVESQQNLEQEGKKEIQNTSSTGDQKKLPDQVIEENNAIKGLQEAFLSLTLVICEKLISANDFEDGVQNGALTPDAFVKKLKTIIEENSQEEAVPFNKKSPSKKKFQATADSLRTVKLCGRIAELMMQFDQYAEQFRSEGFVKSLSKAAEIMSNLESCMLFVGTDFGPKKNVRPLLSDLY